MALWIPSCWRSNESSLLAGDITAAAEADLLLPRCLNPDGIFPFFSFFAGDAVGEEEEASVNSSGNPILPFFLETLTYNGLISFKYFCITSFENLFDDDDDDVEESILMISLRRVFLRLEALVNSDRFGASSILNLIVKSLFCFLDDSVFSTSPVFSALSAAMDLGFLNIATRSFGADLSNEIGDWGFKLELELELGSIGKIFLLDKTSVEDKDESVAVAVCCWLSLLLWAFFLLSKSETVSSSSKNESSPSSNSLSEQIARLGAASASMVVVVVVVSLFSSRVWFSLTMDLQNLRKPRVSIVTVETGKRE